MGAANRIASAALLAMAILPAGLAWSAGEQMHGGHDHSHHMSSAAPEVQQGAPLRLPDTVLTDQDGRQQRLLSDVVADKVVIVSFLYTNCTAVCPIVSHTFSQLQDQLGGLFDTRVRLVSLTVDPLHDTPGTLKTYSALHGARPGWLWLTGSAANVSAALRGFGAYSANFENHPAVVLVGDGRSGKWTRLYDIDDPQLLLAKARQYLAARGQDKLASAGKE
jgi:protein SCO1/2